MAHFQNNNNDPNILLVIGSLLSVASASLLVSAYRNAKKAQSIEKAPQVALEDLSTFLELHKDKRAFVKISGQAAAQSEPVRVKGAQKQILLDG